MSTKRKTDNDCDVPPKKQAWALGLYSAMNDPNLRVQEDEKVVVIKDKYPKAQYHFLVMPKEHINSLNKLTIEHVPLLEHMETVGKLISKQNAPAKFRIGYHAVPSMTLLHLHVISDDFNSICLKTKKHWNSFNTDFFIASEKIQEELKNFGKIKKISDAKAKELLNSPLKCNKCDLTFPTMPKLKSHLLCH